MTPMAAAVDCAREVEVREELRSLLRDPRFEKYHEETGKRLDFNVFDVLQYAEFEIRHSNVLAWLLQPEESHRIGGLFLDRFLQSLKEPVTTPEDHVDVKRELHNVDVAIFLENRRRLFAIENKIEMASTKHFEQVRGYEQVLRKEYPGHSVRSILLTMSRDEDVSESDFVHVSWSTIHEIITSLFRGGEFRSAEVWTFVRQYLDTVGRRLVRPEVGRDYFTALLDNYGGLLRASRDVLVKEGEAGVRAMAAGIDKRYETTLVRLVREFQREPEVLRSRVREFLTRRGIKTEPKNNTTKTEFWLYWRWDKAAAALGVPDWRIRWCMTFTYRAVLVSLYFHQLNRKTDPILDEVKNFMRKTPVDRQATQRYPMMEGDWFTVYERILLSEEMFANTRASEVEERVLEMLQEFLDSDESDYRRIEDYFDCLAFRPSAAATVEQVGDAD